MERDDKQENQGKRKVREDKEKDDREEEQGLGHEKEKDE